VKALFCILFCFISLHFLASCPTDSVAPQPIIVDSVSVDPISGDATIGWQQGVDTDIMWYYIFIVNPITGSNDLIDSVAANAPLTYTYSLSNASNESEQLAIGVKDSCENEMLTILDYHNTIFLTHQIDICSASAILRWNAYDDFHSGLNVEYQIYVSANGGAYAFAGTTTSLNYTYSGLSQGVNYQFYVKAVENNGVGPIASSSNIIPVTGDFLINPNFLYEYTATVIDSSHIQVLFYADTAADIKEYIIKRALAGNHVYTTIATVSDYQGMNPLVEFNDYEVDANNFSYFYQIYAVNQCNQTMIISNEGRTIQLFAQADPLNAINVLTWNRYEGWQGNVHRYEIYRSIDGNFNYEFLTTYSNSGDSIMTYTDNVYDLTDGTGEFCYKIKAIEGATVHVGNLPIANSTSNEDCVKHEPLIFIANAFNPGGEFNSTFKPSSILFDFTTYTFMIYDRWGKPVFETNNKDEAWNGKYFNTGLDLPIGAYVYVLKLKSTNGEEFIKRGTVSIIL